MTDEQAAEQMKAIPIRNPGDKEVQHIVADALLTALLTKLGYVKTVHEFEKIPKWYA